ncbi:MAG: CopG family transcriptional regulator [Firmicutes bacterium]|nr:CopG family transcriptional regulator [Bacillota bacterium]
MKKQEVITFKVDATLSKAMEGIPNRSEFIRSAISAALNGACPLCRGTGTLTLEQQRHWRAFAENHRVERCEDCHSYHLVCAAGTD